MTDYTNDPRVEVLMDLYDTDDRDTPDALNGTWDLLAALDAVDPARQWRPIAEAALDGRSYLVTVDGPGLDAVACYDEGQWFVCVGDDFQPMGGNPHHYLPIPPFDEDEE